MDSPKLDLDELQRVERDLERQMVQINAQINLVRGMMQVYFTPKPVIDVPMEEVNG